LTTADANDTLVVITSAQPNTATPVSVSMVTNTGTASLSWTKYKALAWTQSNGVTGCIEVWTATAVSAGTYNITVTYNTTIDDANIVACGVNGAVGFDAGAYTTTTVLAGSTNPAISGVTSTGGSLFVIFADSAGPNHFSFGGSAPANITTTILEQADNVAGAEYNSLGTYYGTSAGALASQTITSTDSVTGTWGVMVFALTSAAPVLNTIAQTLGGVTQAAVGSPNEITQTLHSVTQLASGSPLAAPGNTAFTSSWSAGP
jgi:predicted secreted protein